MSGLSRPEHPGAAPSRYPSSRFRFRERLQIEPEYQEPFWVFTLASDGGPFSRGTPFNEHGMDSEFGSLRRGIVLRIERVRERRSGRYPVREMRTVVSGG